MKLCKFAIGIKPQKRLFRVTSRSGEIVDAIMETVGTSRLAEDYFTRVQRHPDGGFVRLMDKKEESVNSLSVDTENIIFTKDHYRKGSRIEFDDVAAEFRQIWEACQAVLRVKDIRRIGMVGEYRITPSGNPSTALLNALSRVEAKAHVSKFQFQFETRALTTGESGLPDVKKSDFWNTIETYYDSIVDAEHSDEGQITAMLDVQRYYTPLLNGDVPDEVAKLRRRYDDMLRQIQSRGITRNLAPRVEHAEPAE